ncbi:hypothetical protein EIP91_003442 [Steccherinum ochraceum]|uniref:Secreted protein n=1 Tax=Steccherinum ochraceum TaxID=92696 RepID=A0A4R0RCZ7_9APHY|nr:hypothetical protein EIP91_003442 [Steccherinum ochraceum]
MHAHALWLAFATLLLLTYTAATPHSDPEEPPPQILKRATSVTAYHCDENYSCFSNLGLRCYDLLHSSPPLLGTPSWDPETSCFQKFSSDDSVFLCEVPCGDGYE